MTHGNTIHKTKYVPCQGLNSSGLLHCPMRREWIDLEECLAFAGRQHYSHVAHIEDGKCTILQVTREPVQS